MSEIGATDMKARIAELEERLADLERRERVEKRMRGLLKELVPPEVRTHLKAARREQLMAARSMLDHWIDRLDTKERTEIRGSISVD